MWKSKKVIIIAVLAAVILIGATAGVVIAQNQDETKTGTQTLMARVAQILNIDQQKLEDAFNQAAKELKAERLDAYLQKLVEDGKITPEQAQQYKKWLESRPNFQIPRQSPRFHELPPPEPFTPQDLPMTDPIIPQPL